MDRGAWRATVHWAAKSQTQWNTEHTEEEWQKGYWRDN